MATGTFRDEVAALRELRVPICVAHGDGDCMVNVEYIQSLAMPSAFRGGVRMLPGGHWCHRRAPEAFNELLGAFLEHVL